MAARLVSATLLERYRGFDGRETYWDDFNGLQDALQSVIESAFFFFTAADQYICEFLKLTG